MPLHGFAKDCVFELISTTASEAGGVTVGVRLHWRDLPAEPQVGAYPFEYRLEIHFTLYQVGIPAFLRLHSQVITNLLFYFTCLTG